MVSKTAQRALAPIDVVDAEQILARTRKFAATLKERAAQTEAARQVSPEVMDELADIGVFRLLQPRKFGGLELGFDAFVRTGFELGAGCGSTAWCAMISAIHNWLVGLYPLETQQEVWAEPRNLMAGGYAPNGTCEPAAGGIRVTGKWSFASNCDNAAWFLIGVVIPPTGSEQAPTPAWALLPRKDAMIEDTWFSMGMAGTGSKTIAVSEPLLIPAHRVLPIKTINSGAAPGAEVNASALYRLTFSGSAPFTLCSVPVGIAMGALADFTSMAREKKANQQGGPPRPMAELPHVQLVVAEASALIDASTLLLLRDTADIDAKVARNEDLTLDERIRHRRNQAFAAKEAARAVTLLFEALGASGGDLSNPIQRAWRDANIAARHMSLGWPATGALYGQYHVGLKPTGTF